MYNHRTPCFNELGTDGQREPLIDMRTNLKTTEKILNGRHSTQPPNSSPKEVPILNSCPYYNIVKRPPYRSTTTSPLLSYNLFPPLKQKQYISPPTVDHVHHFIPPSYPLDWSLPKRPPQFMTPPPKPTNQPITFYSRNSLKPSFLKSGAIWNILAKF